MLMVLASVYPFRVHRLSADSFGLVMTQSTSWALIGKAIAIRINEQIWDANLTIVICHPVLDNSIIQSSEEMTKVQTSPIHLQ